LDLLLSDHEQLKKMGVAGRQRVETNYRVEDEATRLIEFFRSLQ
jgi:mannosyltransferase